MSPGPLGVSERRWRNRSSHTLDGVASWYNHFRKEFAVLSESWLSISPISRERSAHGHWGTSTRMSLATLFLLAPHWSVPRCPFTGGINMVAYAPGRTVCSPENLATLNLWQRWVRDKRPPNYKLYDLVADCIFQRCHKRRAIQRRCLYVLFFLKFRLIF